MAAPTLKSAVGMASKNGNGVKVKNAPADLSVLRQMMVFNGYLDANNYKTPLKAKLDRPLMQAIEKAQKSSGSSPKDLVICPGDKTDKMLQSKYRTEYSKLAKLKIYTITFNGKKIEVPEADYKAQVKAFFDKYGRYANALVSQNDTNYDIYQEYLGIAQAKEGYIFAFAQMVTMKVGKISFPDPSLAGEARAHASALKRAVDNKDLAAFGKAYPKAEKSIKKFSKEVSRFLSELTGNGQTVITVLEITRDVSFGIVAAASAPLIAPALGGSIAVAGSASYGGTALLKSSFGELGKAMSGQKLDPATTARKVLTDVATDAGTGFVLGKIKLAQGVSNKIAQKVATHIPGKIDGYARLKLKLWVETYLAKHGSSLIEGAVAETGKLTNSSILKGKPPSGKDVEAAVTNIVIGTIAAGFFSNFEKFHHSLAVKHREWLINDVSKQLNILTVKIPGDAFRKNSVLHAQIMKRTTDKLSQEVFNAIVGEVLKSATGKESASELQSQAEKAMNRNAAMQKKIKILLEAEVKAAAK